MKHEEYIVLTIIFLIGLFIWTIPIRSNPLPFGEGDAAWHFANSDAIAQRDTTFWRVPEYIGLWYYNFNKILGPNALEYPPAWHINGALFQVAGKERVVPIYIFVAIACFIGSFALYFLIRKWYGITPAIIATLATVFSYRNIMVYLWGQRPSITAFVFTPLILYSFYQYCKGIYNNENKPVYLYLFILLVAGQFLVHVMASIQTFLIIMVCMILLWIKYKKLPLAKSYIKHYLFCSIILLLLTAPFYVVYLGADSGAFSNGVNQPNRLLYWFDIKHIEGYPDIGGAPLTYYDTLKNYFYGYWVLVIIGIVYLLLKRSDHDLMILGWLVGTYLSLHLDILGILPFHRVSRLLIGETFLFYTLIVIGIFGFIDLLKSGIYKSLLRSIAIVLFIYIILMNFNIAKETLIPAYDSSLIRINSDQYNAALWLSDNIPHDSQVYYLGQASYPKQRFMYVISQSYGIFQRHNLSHGWLKPEYVLIDYSDMIAMDNVQGLYFLNEWEKYLKDYKEILTYPQTGEIIKYPIDGTPVVIHKGSGVNIYKIEKGNKSEISN